MTANKLSLLDAVAARAGGSCHCGPGGNGAGRAIQIHWTLLANVGRSEIKTGQATIAVLHLRSSRRSWRDKISTADKQRKSRRRIRPGTKEVPRKRRKVPHIRISWVWVRITIGNSADSVSRLDVHSVVGIVTICSVKPSFHFEYSGSSERYTSGVVGADEVVGLKGSRCHSRSSLDSGSSCLRRIHLINSLRHCLRLR